MRIANYHTHIYLCKHATGTIEEYLNKAIDLGYQELGISDHGPLSDELTKLRHSRRMSMAEFENLYLTDLKYLKNKYQNKITLLGAVEIEFYDDYQSRITTLKNKLDYLVLGQHEIVVNGNYKSVYDPSFNKDDIKVYQNTVVKALKTKLFKILAHPDIFMFKYPTFDSYCYEAALTIIKAAYENNVYLEINANGIRRNLRKNVPLSDESHYRYPFPAFWDIVSQFQKEHPDLKVIINDDSHAVENFNDEATYEAYLFSKRHNIIVSNKINL